MNRYLYRILLFVFASVGFVITCVAQTINATPKTSSKPVIAQNQPTAQSCKKFVQDFYDWYETSSDVERVLKQKHGILDNELFQLLKLDNECAIKSHEICILDSDPFLNSQDPSDKYLVKEVRLRGNRCTTPMMEIDQREAKKDIRVEAVAEWQKDRWVLVDFNYFDPGHPEIKPDHLLRLLKAGEKEDVREIQSGVN